MGGLAARLYRRLMPPSLSLADLRIANPCPASWSRMEGDDRVRFCAQCEKSVYNLSAMTMRDAEALIREKEGRLCVRLYRRTDGTVLTADCPVGLGRRLKHRVSRLWFAAGALVGTLLIGSTQLGDRFSRLFGGSTRAASCPPSPGPPRQGQRHETGVLMFGGSLDTY
jgi:hypothetical protein